MTYRKPPEGWFTFGTHIAGVGSKPILLRFSVETDEGGMPLWEQPRSPAPERTPTMTDYDLTEAVDAAGAESTTPCNLCQYHIGGVTLCGPCREETEHMLTAALPHLEQQIREKVADAILAEYNGRVSLEYDSYNEGFMDALDIAEQIART